MREGRRVWGDVGDDAGGVNEDDGNHDVDDDEKRTAAKIETWNTKSKQRHIKWSLTNQRCCPPNLNTNSAPKSIITTNVTPDVKKLTAEIQSFQKRKMGQR